MSIISKNSNGTAVKTSTIGFSPKRIASKIIKVLQNKNILFDYNFSSKTGSQYLEFDIDNVYFNIRISDHTERCEGYTPLSVRMEEMPTIINNSVDCSILTNKQAKAFYSLIA